MAKFKGSNGDDVFSGGNGKDKIDGRDGNDTLRGMDGDDKISGGKGDDVLRGDAGDDKLKGGDGNDTLQGGTGKDDLKGGDGHDFLEGGAGDDKLKGGDGDDTLAGGAGEDELKGGDGDDALSGGADDDTLTGGSGNDTLLGGAGDDRLYGDGSGSGSGSGSGAFGFDDYLDGGAGDDIIVGGQGEDTVLGGAGNDILFGDKGKGSGSGRIDAQKLWDKGAKGGSGSGSGSGSASGSGSGMDGFADYLDGGAGNDFVFAGGGDDTVHHNVAENQAATDRYAGGRGIDTLVLEFTTAEWFEPAVQADIAAYLAFVAANTGTNGEANNNTFEFTAFDLSVREFENLRVIVDGVELDPTDQLAVANDDAEAINEDDSAINFASVLLNDDVPDLVKEVRLISGPSEGVLTFNAGVSGAPDGSYSFDPNGEFEDLAQGASRNVSFVYEVEDADGDTDQATVTITVTGTNDAPVITTAIGSNQGPVTEAGSLDDGTPVAGAPSATGTLASSDVDTGATATWTGDAAGTYGSFAIDPATGDWSYTLDNAVGVTDALAEGQVKTEIFTATVTDDFGATATQDVTITVTGTNDSPTANADTSALDLSAPVAGFVHNAANGHHYKIVDGPTTFSQALADATAMGGYLATITNPAENSFVQTLPTSSIYALFGATDAASEGTWTWIGGPEAGQTATYLPWASGEPNNVAPGEDAIMIYLNTGPVGKWNDVQDAVYSGMGYIVETDDAPLQQSLDIDVLANDTDVDTGAVLSIQSFDAVSAGGAAISANLDGTLNYAAGTAYDHLSAGETAVDSFGYVTTDEFGATSTATVSVTVTGTNSAPVANALSGEVTENPTQVDHSGSIGTTAAPNAGRFYIFDTETGASVTVPRDFGANNSFDQMAALHLSSGNGIVAQVNPNNSGWAFASHVYVGGVGTAIASNQYAVTDTDGGSITASTDKWLGFANANQNVDQINLSLSNIALNDGSSLSIDMNVNLIDYEVNSTDDISVGNVQFASNRTGIPSSSTTLTAAFTDADISDTHSFSVDVTGTVGAVTNNGNGTFSYDANGGFEHLAEGQTTTDTFTYTVTDNNGASDTETVTITVTGTNDAPVASGGTGTVSEDGTLTATGNLAATDADISDTLAYSIIGGGTGTYGTMTVDANGQWTYALDNNASQVQDLNTGDAVVDSFDFLVDDGNGGTATATVDVTVNGEDESNVSIGNFALDWDTHGTISGSGANSTVFGPMTFTGGGSHYSSSWGLNARNYGGPNDDADREAFNGWASDITIKLTSGDEFDFLSASLADGHVYASSSDAGSVIMNGYNNGSLLYTETIILADQHEVEVFNFNGIDELEMLAGSNGWYSVDDMQFFI